MIEPIQGESGVIIPPPDYLPALRAICDEQRVLLVLDEIQSGLGRTGKTFAFEHEGIRPDLLILGKALGGGIVPVSAVVGNRDVMGVLHPGEHGSTFGGNPHGLRRRAVRHRAAQHGRVPAAGDRARGVLREPSRGAGRARCRVGADAGACGPASTSIRRWRPAARSASGWPAAACWRRTPTARPSGWRHRWWSSRASWSGRSTSSAPCSASSSRHADGGFLRRDASARAATLNNGQPPEGSFVTGSSTELEQEQRYIDVLYARLDHLRERTAEELRAIRRVGPVRHAAEPLRARRLRHAARAPPRPARGGRGPARVRPPRPDRRPAPLHRPRRALRPGPDPAARRLAGARGAVLLPGDGGGTR